VEGERRCSCSFAADFAASFAASFAGEDGWGWVGVNELEGFAGGLRGQTASIGRLCDRNWPRWMRLLWR
jgi:hypothetical protein